MAQLQAYQRPELCQHLSVVPFPFEAFSLLNGRSMFVRALFKCVTDVLNRPTYDITSGTDSMLETSQNEQNL